MDKQSSGGPRAVNPTLKQLATGVAGGLIVLLIVAIWGWISGGELVRVLGGITASMFNEELKKVHTQITKANQKTRSVEIGLGEAKNLDTPYQATSAGFVIATANLGRAGRCILYGYAAAEFESVNAQDKHPDSIYLRGVSALQYAPGDRDGPRHEDLNPYLPLGSITFPVKRDEFWTVRGCNGYGARIKFYTLELSGQ